MTRWKDGIYTRACCNVWKSRSCLPNRVTLISFVVGAKFRSPVPDRRRCSPFKENLLFPTGTIRSKRISVRMENDFFPVFSPFFFFFLSPYQLNELFFIRRQRYAISAIPFFVASLTSILSLERTFSPPLLFFFLLYFFSFSPLSFSLYSLIPRPLVFSLLRYVSSAVGQPRSFCLYFLHRSPFYRLFTFTS